MPGIHRSAEDLFAHHFWYMHTYIYEVYVYIYEYTRHIPRL